MATKSPLGIDIGGIDDVDPTLNFVDANTAAAQSVLTTLLHDPGVLWWAPSVGDDVRKYLHKPFDEQSLNRTIVRQSQLDERVESATVESEEIIIEGQRAFSFSCNLVFVGNNGDADFTLIVSEAGEVLSATVN